MDAALGTAHWTGDKLNEELPLVTVHQKRSINTEFNSHTYHKRHIESTSSLSTSSSTSLAVSALVAALKDCRRLRDLKRGKHLHSWAIQRGLSVNNYVSNSLIDMYAKCGRMEFAREVFDNLLGHDLVSWNTLIMGYVDNGEAELSLHLFQSIESPDSRTFVAGVLACSSLTAAEDVNVRKNSRWLGKAQKIYCLSEENRCCNVFVKNAMIEMYAKCGSMPEARHIFDTMEFDVVCWNSMLHGYVENRESELALELFDLYNTGEYGVPNARTFVAVLSACSALAFKARLTTQKDGKPIDAAGTTYLWLIKGKAIHSQAVNIRCVKNIYVQNTLIDMYAKCGSMVDARIVFDEMSRRDVVSWTALLQGYVDNGEGKVALELFDTMEQSCMPDARAYIAALSACAALGAEEREEGSEACNKWSEKGKALHLQAIARQCCNNFVESTLVDMYAKCGKMLDACKVFDEMAQPDVVVWTALIMGYVENAEYELALELLSVMQSRGVVFSSATYVAAVIACGNLMAVETGKAFHEEIRRHGYETDVVIANSLVVFYSKCGCMDEAKEVFDGIQSKTIISWTALMCGYSLQGDTSGVFKTFEKMREQGVRPNEVTFVCLLAACSHAGLTEKGRAYFDAMASEYSISPTLKHYNCMVDLLGRANHLEEALRLVRTMPFKPNVVTWTAIFGACRKWNNIEIGQLAYDSLLKLEEKSALGYVSMAGIYKNAGMSKKGVWFTKGQTCWVDETGKLYKFISDDRNVEMYEEVRELMRRLNEKGYVREIRASLYDEEDALCGHSEKLAVACALGRASRGTSIRMTKNVRVCSDCHECLAVVSKLEKRVVYCRDPSRLHIFEDGKCSCGNYW